MDKISYLLREYLVHASGTYNFWIWVTCTWLYWQISRCYSSLTPLPLLTSWIHTGLTCFLEIFSKISRSHVVYHNGPVFDMVLSWTRTAGTLMIRLKPFEISLMLLNESAEVPENLYQNHWLIKLYWKFKASFSQIK